MAKTACSKLEGELKQEKGNTQDLRKMLADERNVMSTMDMEHQQQLVELEQRHQEKVTHPWENIFSDGNLCHCSVQFNLFSWFPCRFFTSSTSCRTSPSVRSQKNRSRKRRRAQKRESFSSASKSRFTLWIYSTFSVLNLILKST